MTTSTLPSSEQRAIEIDEAFQSLMDIVRDIVSDEIRSDIITLWVAGTYNSRALGWSEGFERGYDVTRV